MFKNLVIKNNYMDKIQQLIEIYKINKYIIANINPINKK